jgi:hypothetical protein
MRDELRRLQRIAVCCRAVVRDRYGVWTGVTENMNERGCLVLSSRLLRTGTWLYVSLSSDLFPEELDVVGEVVWATGERIAIAFQGSLERSGGLTPSQFVARLIEHGDGDSRSRIVPNVRSGSRPVTSLHFGDAANRERPGEPRADEVAEPIPLRRPSVS